jgi:hypothetical protein
MDTLNNSLSDFAVAMIIVAISIVLALVVYFVIEVCAMIAAKSKPRRVDPIVVAWPTILPCQSMIDRQIEEATPPLHIAQAEQVAALRWKILEMSPISEEGSDDL